jgi:hypothetical protein
MLLRMHVEGGLVQQLHNGPWQLWGLMEQVLHDAVLLMLKVRLQAC